MALHVSHQHCIGALFQSSGVYQLCGSGVMHECSNHKLLISAALMHHADKWKKHIKALAALKGLHSFVEAIDL